MTDATKSIPAEALRFVAPLTFAAPAADSGTAKRRKLTGVAYSGDAISPHYYWGSVIFDLASTTAADRIPVLVEHDRAQRAGFASLAIGPNNITIADGELLDTPLGQQVGAEADSGFPWQLSVHIEPQTVQQLGDKEMAVVNGRQVHGPAAIFRNSLIREVSLTPTGKDPNTTAAVFSAGAPTVIPNEAPTMTTPAAPTAEQLATLTDQVTKLSAQVATITAERDAAKAEAKAATDALAGIKASARLDAVKNLFSATGRTFSDDAAKPYIGMDDATFAAVSADLAKGRATTAPHLFAETAINGKAADGALDPHKFAAEVRQVIADGKKNGRSITHMEAVAQVRAAHPAAAAA